MQAIRHQAHQLKQNRCDTDKGQFYRTRIIYNRPMPATHLHLLAERIEQLLSRHTQLQHSNTVLAQQIMALTQERDSLKSRQQAARARIDQLLDRLPITRDNSADTGTTNTASTAAHHPSATKPQP